MSTITDDDDAQLERFRHAAYSVYAASLPQQDVERMQDAGLIRELPLGMDEAMAALTELEVANREPDPDQADPVPRLFTLHTLADAVNRRPDLVDEESRKEAIAGAILARVSDRSRKDVIEGLEKFAETSRFHPLALTPARWRQFLEAVGEPTADRIIVSKPGCNDDQQVPRPNGHAATIKSRFWTNASVQQMAGLVDPKKWVTSGTPFWREMSPLDGSERTTTNPPGYTARFKERVMLPLIGEVTVHLDIVFERTADYVHTTYQLAASPPETQGDDHADPMRVVFDSGWICATSRTLGPEGEPTLVEGLKSIQFANPLLNDLPDLACDGGWVFLMINMALKGAELPESPAVPYEVHVAEPKGPVASNIEGVVDAWVDQATGSLRDHGAAVKTAVGRALGPDYDLEWVNDLLGTGKGAVEATKHTIEAWRKILDALATLEKDR